MSVVEEAIIQPKSKSNEDPVNYPIQLANQMMALGNTVENADAAPTQGAYAVFDELSRRLDEQLVKWKEIREKDLAAIISEIQKANIPLIVLPHQ